MGAGWIAVLDQAITNLTGEHVFFFILANLLGFAVLRTEHRDGATEVVSFQCKLRLDGLLKRLGQIFGWVKHSTIINVGNVHFKHVPVELGLGGFDRHTALPGDPTDGHFRNSAQEGVIGRILGLAAHRSSHDFGDCTAAVNVGSAQVCRQFSTAKVGENRRSGGLIHREPLISALILDGPFGLGQSIHHGIGGGIRRVVSDLRPTGGKRWNIAYIGDCATGNGRASVDVRHVVERSDVTRRRHGVLGREHPLRLLRRKATL
jgi:hypothetical protein